MDTSGMSMDPFAASSFFNKRDIHLFSHLWFVFYINRFVYVFVLFFVYSRISSVNFLVNDNILYFFKVKWEHQVLLFFFVAMKRKKTKKKIRWELMSWRHVSKGSSSSSSVKTLLKMRDNPLSHASRFTAKLARLFNWKQDAHTETISKIYRRRRDPEIIIHSILPLSRDNRRWRTAVVSLQACLVHPAPRHNGDITMWGGWRHNGMDRIICLWAAIIK
jgi:hypothetical protein